MWYNVIVRKRENKTKGEIEMLEQIKKELDRIERLKFYLAMKDRWNHDDFALDAEYDRQIRELEKKLKEVEAND